MRAGPLLRRPQSSLAPPPPCEYAVKWWWSLSQEVGSVGAMIWAFPSPKLREINVGGLRASQFVMLWLEQLEQTETRAYACICIKYF